LENLQLGGFAEPQALAYILARVRPRWPGRSIGIRSLAPNGWRGCQFPQSKEGIGLKKIYVGNLSYNLSDQDLMNLFAEYGEVSSATVILDRETGRSRGFGFVEMDNDSAALAAIEALNGRDFEGRTLNVNEARPRQPRGRSRW
jgi:hypothetical protein